MKPASLTLGPNDVHVWWILATQEFEPIQWARYETLLNDDELHKKNRYHFEKDQRLCLLARVLVRTTLSLYAQQDPKSWRFETNAYGRPHLVAGQTSLPLRFNISHTEGMVACAVGLNREVGVDVERVARSGETISIADRFFSPFEVQALHQVPAWKQRERFFQYWTLKESYIKARGMGLAIPLEQFSFHLDEGNNIAISFDTHLNDKTERWQFEIHKPTPEHALAMAGERLANEQILFSVRQITPVI